MKSLNARRAIFDVLTCRPVPHLQSSSKYFLSTQSKEDPIRNLRLESEQKAVVEYILPAVILRKEIKNAEDWKAVRTEIFESKKQITPINIDSIIMNFCIRTQNYNLAYSYMEFLKQENFKPNLATIGKYFKLFYFTNCDKIIDKNEEHNILQLYKQVRETYKLLNESTCENIIYALSITRSWKECLKLLDEIKITCVPGVGAYSMLATAAFKNNETDLGWQLLNEMIDQNRSPYSVAYLAYLEQCRKTVVVDNILNDLEKLFEFFRLHDIKCDTAVAEKTNDIYSKLQLNSKPTTVNNRGICQNCKQKLQKFDLQKGEFENLKNAIFKNVIVGQNVFYRTTPEELKHFQNFIADMKNYDVVIDGLNVAYSIGTKQSPHTMSSLLASVVKHFANQNKRILVLGRTHMKNWPTKNWSYITQAANTFLANNLSQDDPYLLYCALSSGMDTIIVSKDLMRSHLFKLKDPRLKVLFSQWLTQNQYQLQYVNNQGKVFFRYPLPYVRTAQKHQKCWHIPYDGSDSLTISKWLCLSN